MPRAKKVSPTLTLTEFDTVAGLVTDLLGRMRATLMTHEPSLALVERLASAGFFPAKGATTQSATAKTDTGAKAPGQKRRGPRRRHPAIDPAEVIAAVKKGGAGGQTSGQIAQTLKVPTSQLGQQLYKLRDAGSLRMVGKRSKAKYVVADVKAARAEKPVKPAKVARKSRVAKRISAAKRARSSKQAKPASSGKGASNSTNAANPPDSPAAESAQS